MMNTNTHQIPLSQKPIFVVGYPRSGTTLLQALLATQEGIATFPETHFFSTVFSNMPRGSETIPLSLLQDLLEEIIQKSGLALGNDFAKGLKNTHFVPVKALFEEIVRMYLPCAIDSQSRWLEKTPRHSLFMEEILHFYPEAQFVGIIRNPFSAIHSRTKYFVPKVDEPLAYLSKEWVRYSKSLAGFLEKNPQNTYLIKYEDLTRNTTEVVSDICSFLEINFEEYRLKSFNLEAGKIIMPYEYWKKDVFLEEIFEKKVMPEKLFTKLDILKIQSIVMDEMCKYSYEKHFEKMQLIYNSLKFLHLKPFFRLRH